MKIHGTKYEKTIIDLDQKTVSPMFATDPPLSEEPASTHEFETLGNARKQVLRTHESKPAIRTIDSERNVEVDASL